VPPVPVSLNEEGLRVVFDAAKLVPPTWRCRFLDAVVHRLLPIPQTRAISTDDVRCAVNFVLCRVGVKGDAAA
jgi:hypothetical protein